MKSSTFINFLLLSNIFLLFNSCSKDDAYILDQDIVREEAVLLILGEQNFTDNLMLNLTIPENEYGLDDTGQLILQPYFQLKGDTTTWHHIPFVEIENNYKIYYSRGDGQSDLNIHVEKFDSNEPYGKVLQFSELRIICHKSSSLQGLTQEDLNTKDYYAMIEFFNLK